MNTLTNDTGAKSIAPGTQPPAIEEFARAPVRGGTNNIFSDLSALRLSDTDTVGLTGARELLSHVPVRKPNRHEFFRVHSDPGMSLSTTVFTDKEERETFFVTPAMREALVCETKPVLLTTAVTRQGVVMIFPLNLQLDGRSNSWHDTAREAAELAKKGWIRMVADMQLGAYRIYKAEGELSDPVWPEQSFSDLLEIAFRGRIIDRLDHPVVRRLRGQA
jgi:hypothetical protein